MSIKRQTRSIRKRIGSSEISLPIYGIYLELNKRTGNGFYSVEGPEMAVAIIDTLVRMAKGQLVRIDTDSSRHISLRLSQQVDNQECESERGSKQSEEIDQVPLREQA